MPAEHHRDAQQAGALGIRRELGLFSQEKTELREGNLVSTSKYLTSRYREDQAKPYSEAHRETGRATVTSCNKWNSEEIWGIKEITMRWWSAARGGSERLGNLQPWRCSRRNWTQSWATWPSFEVVPALSWRWTSQHPQVSSNLNYPTILNPNLNEGSVAGLTERERKRQGWEWGLYRLYMWLRNALRNAHQRERRGNHLLSFLINPC